MDEPITLAHIIGGASWMLPGLLAAGFSRIQWDVDWKSEHVALLAMLGPAAIPMLLAMATLYRLLRGNWPGNK